MSQLLDVTSEQASFDELKQAAEHNRAMCHSVKQMIVDRLDLPVEPEWITNDQPLIARGLELDSVDILELIIGLEAVFGVGLTDEEVGAFGSVARLVERIEAGEPLGSAMFEASAPPDLSGSPSL